MRTPLRRDARAAFFVLSLPAFIFVFENDLEARSDLIALHLRENEVVFSRVSIRSAWKSAVANVHFTLM
jgi:hypothetical protein